jgi:hypothetical protein
MGDKPMNDTDTDLKDAMQALRPVRQPKPITQELVISGIPSASLVGRPRVKVAKIKAAPSKAKARTKAKPPKLEVLVPEILEDDGKNGIEKGSRFDLKEQLTDKELRFIELVLSGEHTKETAMELAGYAGMNKSYLRLLASKIIAKYETKAGDHRKIMRARGYGEVKVIELLIDSAENAPTATVKLNARIALAKCLGLNNDVVQTHLGVNIIITGRSPRPPDPVEGGGRPAQIHAVQPPKPRQITR